MSESQNKTNQRWVRRIEYALLAGGFMLLAFWGAARVQGILSSRAALRKFAALNLATSASADRMHGRRVGDPSTGVDFTLWDEKRVQAYGESVANDLAATPLAVLRIPKIRLEVPVFDGTDSLTLNRAVGRIPGTARLGERGNVGLAGHRDGFFRGLKDVSVGDKVELTSGNATAIYTVDQVSIVSPHDVSVLHSRSTPSLTLVTCYPFYFVGSAPQRYIISASLARQADPAALQSIAATNNFAQLKKEKQ